MQDYSYRSVFFSDLSLFAVNCTCKSNYYGNGFNPNSQQPRQPYDIARNAACVPCKTDNGYAQSSGKYTPKYQSADTVCCGCIPCPAQAPFAAQGSHNAHACYKHATHAPSSSNSSGNSSQNHSSGAFQRFPIVVI